MAITKVSTAVVDMSGNTGGLVIAKGTTAQQLTCNPPTTNNLGSIRENTDSDKNKVEVCTANGGTPLWQFLEEVGPTTVALIVDYLVVAGGGGGTGAYGNGNGTGAGGAGGLITTSTYGGTENVFSAATGTPYDIVVGAFGAGGIPSGYGSPNNNNRGLNGGNSKFNTAESIGGGGGGAVNTSYPSGASGGSGGGGTPYSNSGGLRTINQGNSGGAGSSTPGPQVYRGGGGGGASQAGASGDASGNGGNGATNAITVSSGTGPYYAGGGGGGVYSTGVSAGTGGSGVGGNGAANSGNGSSGVANTGSGGGGAGINASGSYSGGNGGSGIVILRYPSSYTIDTTQIGSDLSSTNDNSVSGYTITTIICANSATTGSGTITFALTP